MTNAKNWLDRICFFGYLITHVRKSKNTKIILYYFCGKYMYVKLGTLRLGETEKSLGKVLSSCFSHPPKNVWFGSRYGSLHGSVLGLEAVLADGTVISSHHIFWSEHMFYTINVKIHCIMLLSLSLSLACLAAAIVTLFCLAAALGPLDCLT